MERSTSPTFSFPNLTNLELERVEFFDLFAKTFLDLEHCAPKFKNVSLSERERRTMHGGRYQDSPYPVEKALEILSSSGPHTKIESIALVFDREVNVGLINSLQLKNVFPSLKYLKVTIPAHPLAEPEGGRGSSVSMPGLI